LRPAQNRVLRQQGAFASRRANRWMVVGRTKEQNRGERDCD
jgi:hypothetical protein